MTELVTSRDLIQEMLAASREIDTVIDGLRMKAQAAAEAERAYRKGRAEAWVTAPDGLAKFREDAINAVTADLRFARDLATDLKQVEFERLRVLKARLSVLQTISNSVRDEVGLAGRYGASA